MKPSDCGEKRTASATATAAMVVLLLVVTGSAAYFYSQDQALQGQLATKSASDQAVVGALQIKISALEANITALEGQDRALRGEVALLDENLSAKISEVYSLKAVLSSLQAQENFGSSITVVGPEQVEFNQSGSLMITFYQPLNVPLQFAGYLNFTVSNPTPSNLPVNIGVEWSGYGINYSSTTTVVGSGSVSFPVLPTPNLSFTVYSFNQGNITLTAQWVS